MLVSAELACAEVKNASFSMAGLSHGQNQQFQLGWDVYQAMVKIIAKT
jgi:hypothetical protein